MSVSNKTFKWLCLSVSCLSFAAHAYAQAPKTAPAQSASELEAKMREAQNKPVVLKTKPKHLLQPGEVGYVKKVAGPPKDFPLPILPKATIMSADESNALGINGTTKRTFRLRFGVESPPAEVMDWYRQALSGEGWKIKEREIEKMRLSSFDLRKGPTTADITFFPLNKKKTVTLVIMTVHGF